MTEQGAAEAAPSTQAPGSNGNASPSLSVPPTRLPGFGDPLPAPHGRKDAEGTWMQGYPYLGFEEVVPTRPVRCYHAEHLLGPPSPCPPTPQGQEGDPQNSGRRVYCIKSEQAFSLEPELLAVGVVSLMSYGRHHPRLLRCYYAHVGRGVYDHRRTDLTFVLDDCRLGNLSQKVVRYKRRRELLDERVVWVYAVMILEALQFVHAQKRPHKEVRPWTVWLMEGGEVKLAPPPIPELLDAYQEQHYGPDLLYFSPDLFVSEEEEEREEDEEGAVASEEDGRLKQRQARDVWALGCVLHELCALRPAFKAHTPREVRGAVCSGTRTSSIPPSAYSPELLCLINECLTLQHHTRPTVNDLLSRPEVVLRRASLVKPHHQLVPHHFATPQLLTLAPLAAVRERDGPLPCLSPGARLEQHHLPNGYYGPMVTAGEDVTALLLSQPHSAPDAGSPPSVSPPLPSSSSSSPGPPPLRRGSTRNSFNLPYLRWPIGQTQTPTSPTGGGVGNGLGSPGGMANAIGRRLSGMLTPPPLLSPTSPHAMPRQHVDDTPKTSARGSVSGGVLPTLFGINREQHSNGNDSVTRSKNRFGSYEPPSSPSSQPLLPTPRPPPRAS